MIETNQYYSMDLVFIFSIFIELKLCFNKSRGK